MITRIAACLLLLLTAGCRSPELPNRPPESAALHSRQQFTPAAPPMAPAKWSVSLWTSGGFAGTGKGGIRIGSDSRVEPEIQCGLREADRLAVEQAVARAKPQRWEPAYDEGPHQRSDQFFYSLRLMVDEDGKHELTFTTHWRDETADRLPEDLRRLSDTLSTVMDRLRECR